MESIRIVPCDDAVLKSPCSNCNIVLIECECLTGWRDDKTIFSRKKDHTLPLENFPDVYCDSRDN